MKFATVIYRLTLPRAVLACLAWAFLQSSVRAELPEAPLPEDTLIGEAPEPFQGETFSFQPTSQGQESSLVGDPIAPPDMTIRRAQACSKPAAWPTCDSSLSSAPAPAQASVWRWIPMGMIPHIGPRTPDDQKDLGIGEPLAGNGWRCQPFSISTFVGATDGGPLIPGHVYQRPSFYGGLNFGWDYDHYWGIEKRLGFGALSLANGEHQPLPQTGMSVTGEYRVMYYPLGDARWRPFLTAGVGWSDFYFNDDRSVSHLETVGMVPFGLGLKYLYSGRIAARVDLIDEYTFGNSLLSNFQYVALTAGLELRYGQRWLRMPWSRKDGS